MFTQKLQLSVFDEKADEGTARDRDLFFADQLIRQLK